MGHPDLPSPRVCRLMLEVFTRWEEKPLWLSEAQTGSIFDDVNGDELRELKQKPVCIRKSLAIRKLLQQITSPDVAEKAGSFSINAEELIVGVSPPFSVGQGKEQVRYLTEEEELSGAINFFNDRSTFGHIIPNYESLMQLGLSGLIQKCTEQKRNTNNEKQLSFLESVVIALESVIVLAEKYRDLCSSMIDSLSKLTKSAHLDDNEKSAINCKIDNLKGIADRLENVPAQPPRTFLEACQSLFLVHVALHTTGETTSVGRLDQILHPFYQQDVSSGLLDMAQAQEIIDCLWLKFDERAMLHRRHAEDRFTFADGALLGNPGPSNFDQGALLNQWMQQVTIGGVVANNDDQQTDATNDLTYMCLQASRRLPLNSPTLDLRLHRESPPQLIDLAAKTILSGGAHPVLLNDDRIISQLQTSGEHVELKSARNYACDGCYETHFAGESEFSFGFVPALDVLEKTLNRGATFGGSGEMYLRGMKWSWRTIDASDMTSYDDDGDPTSFWTVFKKHLELGCHRFLNGILTFYGVKEPVSPSPLLSALINGCIEKRRDLYGGGARYHIFAPLMTGISNCADSLFVIKHLVFEEKLFTLEELVSCLRSNWGRRSIVIGKYLPKDRIEDIRRMCMFGTDGSERPKFGQGINVVDELAWALITEFAKSIEIVKQHPRYESRFEELRTVYGEDFELLLTPGVGTFEQYVFGGSFAGATPDGRLAGTPIASDLSAAPIHSDLPAIRRENGSIRHCREVNIFDGLTSFAHESIDLLSDGAPPDFNVREDFPEDQLVRVVQEFAAGRGGNVLTITAANPETLEAAAENHTEFNLVRNRMGGWTEFFVTLSKDHQHQHMRRPLYVSGRESNGD